MEKVNMIHILENLKFSKIHCCTVKKKYMRSHHRISFQYPEAHTVIAQFGKSTMGILLVIILREIMSYNEPFM